MGLETGFQWLVHSFEQGSFVVWLRRLIIAIVFAAVAVLVVGMQFNGFNDRDAMDQAQIGRQLASGQGYTTLYARPLALHVMLARTGQVPQPLPDVSQAPLGPAINAVVLRLAGMNFAFEPGQFVMPAERVIAATGFVFFLASLVLVYFLGRRLFDARLALLGTGLIAVMDLFWRFSTSGLPQMAMLFFFNAALLSLLAAMDAQDKGRPRRAHLWAFFAAALLSVVTLGHGIGLWIFAGFWLFATTVIRPHWPVALATPVIFAVPLLPWAWLNWRAVRQPLGLPFFELYRTEGTDPLAWLADFEPLLRLFETGLLSNIAENIAAQLQNFLAYFGGNFVAAAFFLALFLHTFRRWEPAQFRWAVLLMWSGALAGMILFGTGSAISVNQLHVLFLPVMTFYGLAFLLVLWGRLELGQPLLRSAFLVFLYAILSIPLVGSLMANKPRVNWPPYVPPLITRFSVWLQPNEAMASDMPWASAWYASRMSLLLPESIEQFELISSERLLGQPLVGIYLTPVSGDNRAYGDIINGRYREWARFVLREVRPEDLRGWMLTSAINLPIDGGAIFFADRPRWR
jgi:4-amino-4-deoxy-L-arabinose transferase-like glycosyltransferase